MQASLAFGTTAGRIPVIRPAFGKDVPDPKASTPANAPASGPPPTNTPPPATTPSANSWLAQNAMWIGRKTYWPLVQAIGMVFTRPALAKKYLPDPNRNYLDPGLLPKYAPITEAKMTTADGHSLESFWMPAPTQSDKTVIVGHGYKADIRTVIGVAQKLRELGYNTFMFNFRAHGGSTGKATSFGYHEAQDVATAVEYVKKHHSDGSVKLFYYGHSMGAAAAMMAPEKLKGQPQLLESMTDKLDGLILDAPFAYVPVEEQKVLQAVRESLGKSFLGRYGTAVFDDLILTLKKEAKTFMGLDIDFEQLQPGKLMTKHRLAQKPILLIHGTHDTTTPFKHAQSIISDLKRVSGNQAQFLVLNRSDHLTNFWQPFADDKRRFSSAVRGGNKFFNGIEQFLAKHSASPTAP